MGWGDIGKTDFVDGSKKSPPAPTERTPEPEYLIAGSQLAERGPLGFGPIQFFDGMDKENCRGATSLPFV